MSDLLRLLGSSSPRICENFGVSSLTTEPSSRSFHAATRSALDEPHFLRQGSRASAISAQVTPDPGNTFATAYNLGPLGPSPIVISDSVGTSDRNDYYQVSISTPSIFNLTLTGLTADADVRVFDVSAQTIASSAAAGTNPEAISRSLAAGTYYIQVYQYQGDTSYTLSIAASETTSPSSFNPIYGYGLVNASAAIAQATNQTTLPAVPNLGGNNWGADLVNAPEVWAKGYTGQGTVVAVIDSGVDYAHPDLDSNIWLNTDEVAGNGIDDDRNGFIDDIRGWDFVNADNDPADLDGHGTHVAGTIAAENNGFGATGIAYNAQIMPVRVLDAEGYGSPRSIAAGIRYAADNGANVINLSLGGGYSSDIDQAIQYAVQKNVVVAMASGNESASQPSYPARQTSPGSIAVGAVDRNDQVASFSNRAGDTLLNYVVAPGVSIYSTTPKNAYQSYSGTSMATPHVAAVAALIRSANPTLSAAQVTGLITKTANQNGIVV